MRFAYTLVMSVLVPLAFVRLWVRGLTNPAYRGAWRHRFGFVKHAQSGQRALWVHAVSVGEVQAAVPLLQALRASQPHRRIVVTTTTPTGKARLAQVFGESVEHAYLPFDLPWFMRRFLGRCRPGVCILMETELWPNLVKQCALNDVPVVLANARLSERSARGYRRVASITAGMLKSLTLVGAQSQADADRLIKLGASVERIFVMGNIKLDVHIAPSVSEEAQVLRRAWGEERSVWIAASTHEGEESMVLRVHQKLRNAIPDLALILVPRHPERARGVASLCEKSGLLVQRRSETIQPSSHADVYLVDTMGALAIMYAASDIAFVGGSFVDVGGHNLLEPAALGIPVLFGPSMHNFAQISTSMSACGASIQTHTEADLEAQLYALLRDANARHAMGQQGRAFVNSNRGALNVLLERLGGLVDEPS